MRPSRDELYRKQIEELKEAHEREIRQVVRLADVLAEQVDYLRGQLGRPNMTRVASANPTGQPPLQSGEPGWMSEEEEDILALKEFGHLNEYEAEQLAEQVRVDLGLASVIVDQ